MKKLITIILLSILMVFMTGCDNATANVSDSNKMLMKIGKTTYTKGQLYNDMMKDDAANMVVSEAMQMIANAEVETTADLQQEAQKIYDDYHDQIMATTDEPFEEAIKLYGYDSVEAFREYCLSSAKTNHLTEQYIDEKWDDLLVEYYPLKARMIYVSAQENGPELSYSKAEEALAALKSGTSFEDVAKKYSDNISLADEKLYTRNSSSLDYNVLQYLTTVTTTGLSQVITNKDVNGYYIVQVTNVNPTQLKDDFVTLLKSDTNFGDTVITHYFTKHNFTIYDIDVYNTVKTNYPAYLVQKTGPSASK